MDPKASAKSKRSHSQHGRRNLPPPTANAQKKKLTTQTGGEERDRRNLSHALPSNWDRYDDDEGADDNPITTTTTKPTVDVVAPKSKGADFSYLIEEARSQQHDHLLPGSQCSSSFDDTLPDFMQGVSSMLSVRGKGFLSWCGDDNFIVDDDSTSSYEVPFLSLDLDALAAKLSKVNISQRLFIEEDILPADLRVAESNQSNIQVSEHTEKTKTKTSELKHSLDPSAFNSYVDAEKNADGGNDSSSSHTFMEHQIMKAEAENVQSQTSPVQAAKFDRTKDLKPLEQTSQREAPESSKSSEDTIPGSKWNKSSRFEVAAAEAELDMLLGSFDQTDLSSPLAEGSTNDSSAQRSETFRSLAHTGPLNIRPGPSSSRNVATSASLDDALDDLLAETSSGIKDQKHTPSHHQNEGTMSSINLPSLSSHPGRNT